MRLPPPNAISMTSASLGSTSTMFARIQRCERKAVSYPPPKTQPDHAPPISPAAHWHDDRPLSDRRADHKLPGAIYPLHTTRRTRRQTQDHELHHMVTAHRLMTAFKDRYKQHVPQPLVTARRLSMENPENGAHLYQKRRSRQWSTRNMNLSVAWRTGMAEVDMKQYVSKTRRWPAARAASVYWHQPSPRGGDAESMKAPPREHVRTPTNGDPGAATQALLLSFFHRL